MPISVAGSGSITGASTLNGLTVPSDAIAPGVILISSQTFASASAVSVNNCFNSSYENYRILFSGTSSAASSGANLRLRSNGVDASGATDYVTQMTYSQGNTISRLYTSNGQSFMVMGWVLGGSNPLSVWEATIFNPARTVPTGFSGTGFARDGTSAATVLNPGGAHMLSIAYDGFTLYPDSGTLTGTLRVYGNRNTP